MQRIVALIVFVTLTGAARAQDDGFKPMFNGKDLSGWVNVNCAPGSWFVKDNMIITTGKPIGYMRTDRQYENFILEFDWLHAPDPKGSVGNSGLFVWGDPLPSPGIGYTRGIEVQVLVNLLYKDKKTGLPTATSHGDIFSIHGATCKPDRPHPAGAQRCLPSENLCKGEFEWNHYRVHANDGVIKLAVNGKEVSGVSECNPRKGYLALESEGSECRFKNIKIKELPSTNPKPNEIAEVAKDFKFLFTGLDLAGWKVAEGEIASWKMNGGTLAFDGKAKGSKIWSEKSFGDFEALVDFQSNVVLHVRGDAKAIVQLDAANKGWNRALVHVKGDRVNVSINGKTAGDGLSLKGVPATGGIGLSADGAAQFRNLFVRELKRGD